MITNKTISLALSLPFEPRLDLIAHIKRIQYKKGKKRKFTVEEAPKYQLNQLNIMCDIL